MKQKFSLFLALSAFIIMTAGCKKNLPASVDVGANAKAGMPTNPSWAGLSEGGRLIRFDIDDGNASSCLLNYDVLSGSVTMTQVIGTNGTNIIGPPNTGIPLSSGSTLSVTSYNTDITDYYAEWGGVHIIPFDAGGTGHEDHLLYYIPGRGILYLLSYSPSAHNFTIVWSSGSGIAGYNLTSIYDKIIAYDYGSGAKNALIVYRPGYGNIWAIQNIGGGNSPDWKVEVEGSGGVGGFDLKGKYDQIIAVDYNQGAMYLCCYRPGNSYVWYLSHTAYSTTWIASYETRSGLSANGYTSSFANYGDRMFAGNTSGSSDIIADNTEFCYSPGSDSYPNDFAISGEVVSGGIAPSGLSYPFSTNPYGASPTYKGDHVLSFSGNGLGNSSLVLYTNGGSTTSQVYEFENPAGTYTRVD